MKHNNFKTYLFMSIQFMKPLFFSFSDRLNEGGPFFMYPLLLMLLICIGLTVYAFVKGDTNEKLQKLISSISLFALVWGFLGHVIGMIGAIDAISLTTSISYEVLAAGLKVGLLSPVFGMVVFLIARLGIISLILKRKSIISSN